MVEENIIIEKILLNASIKCQVYTTIVILVFQSNSLNNKVILLCDLLNPFYIKNYVEIKKDGTIKLNKEWTSIKKGKKLESSQTRISNIHPWIELVFKGNMICNKTVRRLQIG